MNKKVLLVALLAVATMLSASAQKVSGNLSPLKGQTEINVVLDFSGTMVSTGSVMGKPIKETEEKFVADAIKDKSDAEKEQWLTEWNVKLRDGAYAILVKDMGNVLTKKGISVGSYPNAEYTIIVKVTLIETGHFVGISVRASAITADVSFVKTGETSPFATIAYNRISNGASAYVAYLIARVEMSFGMLGINLGRVISKVK